MTPRNVITPPPGYADWLAAIKTAQGWGSEVIERLAKELRDAFPEVRGFSRANLMYTWAFAQAWSEEVRSSFGMQALRDSLRPKGDLNADLTLWPYHNIG